MKKNVIFLSATSFAFNEYLEDFLNFISEKNSLHLVANCDEGIKDFDATVHDLPFQRGVFKISEFYQILSLLKLFRTVNPSIVYSISPKGGIYMLLIRFLVFRRFTWVHFYTGQVWYNKKGVFRFLLKQVDKSIGRYTDRRLVDSKSQLEFLVKEDIIPELNSFVIGPGSIKGNKVYSWEHCEISRGENLLFVGRANKEKGFDLILRFVKENETWLRSKGITLKIAGIIEDEIIEDSIKYLNHVEYLGYRKSMKDLFLDSRLLLIPSEREGFGSVVVEAGIYGVPSVGTNIVGLRDSLGEYSFKMQSNDYLEFERLIKAAYSENAVTWERRAKSRQEECKAYYRDIMAMLFYEFHLSLNNDN